MEEVQQHNFEVSYFRMIAIALQSYSINFDDKDLKAGSVLSSLVHLSRPLDFITHGCSVLHATVM